MRVACFWLVLLAVLTACRSREKRTDPSPPAAVPSAPVPAAPEREPLPIEAPRSPELPRIGGTVFSLGDATLELVVRRTGLVEAVVDRARGGLLTTGAISARLWAEGSKPQPVTLAHSSELGCFSGHAGAGVVLGTGPAEVEVRAPGVATKARLAQVVALSGPELGGHLLAVGAYAAELLPHADGRVEVTLLDASGAPVEDRPDFSVEARLLSKEREHQNVKLTFEARKGRLGGRLASPPMPGPVELRIQDHGVPATGRIARAALLGRPRHGGRLVAAGYYSAELLLRPGDVEAFVYDAFGEPYRAAHLALMLAFGSEDDYSVLKLAWDPQARAYRARISQPETIVGRAVRLSLTAGARTYLGRLGTARP